MRALYERHAPACPGLPAPFLAGVFKVESDHGRAPGPSPAGAAGPAQFLPGTWAAWGTDGDGDGLADPYSPADAVPAAARYLCALGARDPARLAVAAWRYHHGPAAGVPAGGRLRADPYVAAVLAWAARYTGPAALGGAAALLAHPGVALSGAARQDLEAGVIDQRIVSVLLALAGRYPITVTVLRSGHARYVRGTSTVSNHWHGRAADVFAVGGQPVSRANPSARDAVAWLASLQGPLRPDEVGSPFPEFNPIPGWFHDADHHDHLHIGYGPPR